MSGPASGSGAFVSTQLLPTIKTATDFSSLTTSFSPIWFCSLIEFHLLQVLLHDPAEEPQMKDLAFAVSPGSHTLAAIKITKVSLLII